MGFKSRSVLYKCSLILYSFHFEWLSISNMTKILFRILSVSQFKPSVLFDSLWPHRLQHARLPCSSPTPRAYSNSCPLSQWCHPYHPILCRPLLLLPSIFPSIRVFSNKSVHRIRWPKYWEFQLQHQSFQWIFRTHTLYDWLVWSPCFPRDFQESSPMPQFKSINSSVLCLLYGPTLTSIHD